MSRRRFSQYWIGPVAIGLGATLALSACAGTPSVPSDDTNDDTQVIVPETEALSPTLDEDASGEIAICGSKDSTGIHGKLMDLFNTAQPAVTAKYVELGPDTDSARTAAIQRLEGGATDCDIYLTDVTWTPEWASQGWIYDQTDLVEETAGHVMEQ